MIIYVLYRIMNKSLLVLLFLGAACSAGGRDLRRGGDVHTDFTALTAAHTEGLDYTREVYYRGSQVAVFAVHGGDIEPVTSRLARRTAGKDFNLYIFNGWLGADSGRLHVTSTRFNDPAALGLSSASALGLSFHAQAARGAWVCVGGANRLAAQLTVRRLQDAGFEAETPCSRLPGVSVNNIVNRPAHGGVQLEITTRLLARLEKDAGYLSKFTDAVRQAALEFISSVPKETQETQE